MGAVASANQPCPVCPSSDAYQVYKDGYGHCFSCNAHIKDGESVETKAKLPSDLIPSKVTDLPGRKLTEESCRKWAYGIASYRGRDCHVANFHDPHGNVVAQKLRFADKSFIVLGDISKAGLYGEHLWRDGGRKLVIVEGELDALSLSQAQSHKWPVVSLPQGAQSGKKAVKKSLEWVESFDEVVLLLDNDEPGQQAAQDIALLLTPGKAKIAHLPLKDASDMLKAGRSAELVDATWNGKKYQPQGIVTGEDLWDHMSRELPMADFPMPWVGLNDKLGGFRSQELWMFVAGSGIGKSAACREMAAFLQRQEGTKVGYIALEESVQKSMLGLAGIFVDKTLAQDPDLATEEEKREVFEEHLKDMVFYDHFGSLDSDSLISKLRFMVKAEGVTHAFLDHISIVVSGADADDRKALDILMTKLRSFVQETGIWLCCVSHLKRPEGKGHEDGGQTHLSQLRGSASIAQLSDAVVGFERDQQDEDNRNLTTLRVLKNRWSGDTGRAGVLAYDPRTGRLAEASTADFNSSEGGF